MSINYISTSYLMVEAIEYSE